MSSIRRFLCYAVLLAGAGSCMNPRIQANIAQSMNDITNELTAQRQDMALLQEQVDSLKLAMAHQDSVIKRLINITGLPSGNLQLGAANGTAKRYLMDQQPPEHRLRARDP
jgi:hypothetical protein